MEKLSPGVSDHADAMDPELRRRIEKRAYMLRDANGRPEAPWTTGFKRNRRSSTSRWLERRTRSQASTRTARSQAHERRPGVVT